MAIWSAHGLCAGLTVHDTQYASSLNERIGVLRQPPVPQRLGIFGQRVAHKDAAVCRPIKRPKAVSPAGRVLPGHPKGLALK